ncbi:hypothetical protein L7F22_001799 [Adiantum nelumboides]|nr:hypothetical protein [Adiantum nelumboides]
MDATHIVMERPQGELGLDWYDHNKNYSMLVQCIVDSNMRFMDVFAGFLGSVNDLFYCCAMRGLILNGPKYVNGSFFIGEYIVADGGYPLLPWLMRPYKTPSTPTEKLFSYKLSSTRIVVEPAFGWLKMKWRYLHGKVMKPYPRHLARAIIVRCMLHNMCLDYEKSMDEITIGVNNFDNIINEDTTSDAEATRDSLEKFLQPF